MLTNGFNKQDFKDAVLHQLKARCATTAQKAKDHEWYLAMTRALAEITTIDLVNTEEQLSTQKKIKRVNYFSLEYLIGRLTANNLISLDIYEPVAEIMQGLGCDFSALLEQEIDPALGNGGLGRLAACYMDSLAALEYPAVGYGLHYQFGLFEQEIIDGRQHEVPNVWMGFDGYPWEVKRPELVQRVGFYGHVEVYTKENGESARRWKPGLKVLGVPWDIPIVGYKNNSVYPLRLWECQTEEPFEFSLFDRGDYLGAQVAHIRAGNITKLLYPNDNHEAGKYLRLMQQYFQCSCSIKDILKRHLDANKSLEDLARYETIQLNDTHPAISIAELMRILIDEHEFAWEKAWKITKKVFAYTNHTLLPEALETWDEYLIAKLLPRHLEIIHEINARFLKLVAAQWPNDKLKQQQLSIIDENGGRRVRMATLSVVGSYKVNGVAQIHSQLVKRDLFPDLVTLYPKKFTNVTNGVTPRRWLKACNPALAALICEYIGDDWLCDLNQLERIKPLANDLEFRAKFRVIKYQNKERLASWIERNLGIVVDPHAIFDVQIKRLHEYKRQHLNLIHILSLYYRLLNEPGFDICPRVFIFAAKAAPAYTMAKDIIYAINKVAQIINRDSRINNRIKIVFIPNYKVSLAELIIPAADVSEQISTAGKEASGTGNMKLSLNGALTIGTMDGANIEICEQVGVNNIFIFGLLEAEVKELLSNNYNPMNYYYANPILRKVFDCLETDYFTPKNPGALVSLRWNLLHGGDPYMVLADFADYSLAQAKIDREYRDPEVWTHKAIINVASMGKFSSDRSIYDYASKIWHITPVHLKE